MLLLCAYCYFCVWRKILNFDFIEFDCFSIGSSTHTKIHSRCSSLFAFSSLVRKFHSLNGGIMMYVCFIISIVIFLHWQTELWVNQWLSALERWHFDFDLLLAVYVSFHPLDKSMFRVLLFDASFISLADCVYVHRTCDILIAH